MRVGFVTCVQLGLACMEEIYAAGGTLDLILTLPPDKARTKSGRVHVEPFAARHGIPLVHIGNVNDAGSLAAIRAHRIDWLCIIGWSQIARAEVLAAPREGCLGMHPTLLPEGRGRAAVPWAILKGLPETGVTLFQLDAGVDTGPIVAQERLALAPDEDATSLYARVDAAHRSLIRRVWPAFMRGELHPRPQDHSRATEWPGRTPEDGRLLPSMPVAEAERLVRAVTRPYPGAFIDLDGHRLRVWKAAVDRDPGRPGRRLAFRDGTLVVIEGEIEELPAGDQSARA